MLDSHAQREQQSSMARLYKGEAMGFVVLNA